MIRSTVKSIFSKESIFVLFLFAGYFKESISFLPIDGTIFFFFISFLMVAFSILRKKSITVYSVKAVLIFTPLVILILISYWYTTSEIYALTKTGRFLLFTVWSFIGTLFIIDSKESLLKFLKSIIFFSIVMSLIAVFSFLRNFGSSSGFLTVLGSNYQHLGRASGIGSLFMITLYLYNTSTSKKQKSFILIFIAVSSFVLAICGARMPLLAFFVAILILFKMSIRYKKGLLFINKGIYPLLVLSLILFGFGLFSLNSGALNTTINRFTVLLEEDGGGTSASGRIERYESALEMASYKPFFGYGIGSFPIFHDYLDAANYPHNIFLEFLSELGVVGLLFFIFLLLMSLRNGLRAENGVLKTTVILGFIYLFLNANISGDINDNKLMFTFLAILIILPYISRKKEPAI